MEEQRREREIRSSFAVTCSLLSQFIKESRSYGDLQGIDRLNQQQERAKELYQPPTTMNLFPGSDVAETRNKFNSDEISERNATISMDPSPPQDTDNASKRGEQKEKDMNAQLTIFYDGKVMIFDNFPAIKAKDLVEMASKGKSSVNVNSVSNGAMTVPPLQSDARASVDLSMPIARRASLHRFLEKRKDRINSNAPYLVKGMSEMEPTSEMKPEKNQSWLALGHN